MTYITPASSSKGTEISFKIRVDTPPGTPVESQLPKKEIAEQGKEGASGEEKGTKGKDVAAEEQEDAVGSNPEEEKVPDTTGKSPKEEGVEDKAASPAKLEGGSRGRMKSRANIA